jgi:hypothetical protein
MAALRVTVKPPQTTSPVHRLRSSAPTRPLTGCILQCEVRAIDAPIIRVAITIAAAHARRRSQAKRGCGGRARFRNRNWQTRNPVCQNSTQVVEITKGKTVTGDPSRIRTCNPRSRNPLLYPVELWDRRALHSIANMKNPLPGQARSEPFSPIKRPT